MELERESKKTECLYKGEVDEIKNHVIYNIWNATPALEGWELNRRDSPLEQVLVHLFDPSVSMLRKAIVEEMTLVSS